MIEITTDRLFLRLPREEDLDGFAAMFRDPEVMRFMGGAGDRAKAWRYLAMVSGSWSMRGYGYFTVLERNGGAFVGRVGPWNPGDDWPATEIAYGLLREHWGKGYAFEAAVAAMDWTVENLDWPMLHQLIAPDNTASIRLSRRLGGSYLRTVQGLPGVEIHTAMHVYGQSRESWLQRSAS